MRVSPPFFKWYISDLSISVQILEGKFRTPSVVAAVHGTVTSFSSDTSVHVFMTTVFTLVPSSGTFVVYR